MDSSAMTALAVRSGRVERERERERERSLGVGSCNKVVKKDT